jgi:hypothetical protein
MSCLFKRLRSFSILVSIPYKKSAMAERYRPTYQGILREIRKGQLIHADETKGIVKGGGHYI